MNPGKVWWLMAFALVLSACVTGRGSKEEEGRSRGYFKHTLSVGTYVHVEEGREETANKRLAVAFESKFGIRFNDHLSMFILSAMSMNYFETVADYAEWMFQKDDYTFFRLWLIPTLPMAVFINSQILAGPGLCWNINAGLPSVYIEAGTGLSSVQNLHDEAWRVGFGLFTGIGMDITDDLGFVFRALWSPPWMQAHESDTQVHFFSLLGGITF
jgi:hypothetical protein